MLIVLLASREQSLLNLVLWDWGNFSLSPNSLSHDYDA